MSKKLKEADKYEILFFVLLVAQLFFVFYMNLFHIERVVDYDSSGAYLHTFEMWKQKTLLPKGFGYCTNIDIDSNQPLAALIFGITGNQFFAQGLANVIIGLFIVWITASLMKAVGFDKKAKYIVILLFFVPYTQGQLGWSAMIFSNAASYVIRFIAPILAMLVIYESEDGKKSIGKYVRLFLLAVLAFVSGFSSSVYVALCVFLPLFAYDVFKAIQKDDIKSLLRKRVYIEVGLMVLSMVGDRWRSSMHLTTKAAGMSLIYISHYMENHLRAIAGLFQLFGGLADVDGVTIFSLGGFKTISGWVITCFFIFVVINGVIHIVKKEETLIEGYVLAIAAVNYVVMTLLSTTYGLDVFEYRYHIVPMAGVICLTGKYFTEWGKSKNRTFMHVSFLAVFALIVINLISDDKLWIDVVRSSTAAELYRVNANLEDLGVKKAMVFGSGNVLEGRKLRAYGKNVIYMVVDDNYGAAPTTWGGNLYQLEYAMVKGPQAIIAHPAEFEKMMPVYKDGAKDIGETSFGWHIYMMDKEKLDFVTGLVDYSDEAVDLPYTPGYVYSNAELQDDGTLVSNGTGGTILTGSGLKYDGVTGFWDYTLEYEIIDNPSGGDGIFEICQEGIGYVATPIKEGSNVAVMENVPIISSQHNLENRIEVCDGMKIKIKKITMKRHS